MQKTLFTIFLLFIAISSFAQDTKMASNDTLFYKEKYEVLKSDKKIKQGSYTLVNSYNNNVVTTGFYKNNLKDSIWREYDFQHNLLTEGRYKEGKRVGEWSAYNNNQHLVSKYDFDHDKLVYYRMGKADSTRKYKVIKAPGDTVLAVLDNPAFYVDGLFVIYRDLGINFRFPREAATNRISGTVLINVTIDADGHAINYAVAKKLGYGLDEEAIRNLKLLPPHWMPAKSNGQNVATVVLIPLNVHFF